MDDIRVPIRRGRREVCLSSPSEAESRTRTRSKNQTTHTSTLVSDFQPLEPGKVRLCCLSYTNKQINKYSVKVFKLNSL